MLYYVDNALKEINMSKKGLYANIHAKRKRIAAGSGEKMRKAGSKGAPSAKAFKAAAKTAKKPKKAKKGKK
jgi:homogentisate 1,2-dioxygenase